MNRREALNRARQALFAKLTEDASIEGEILLRHVLGISRAQLFADLDGEISPQQEKILMDLAVRRAGGEPTAYITGHREFYGLDFIVDPNVLIPRPETELLVEKAIKLCCKNSYYKIADIGTGCGAAAISLAVNLKKTTIYAIDISPAALEVARENCRIHQVADKVMLLQGDMLEPLPEAVDLIIANLPYVRETDLDKGELGFEPRLALNGGEEGLDKIEQLYRQAGEKLRKNGSLLMEIGQGQAEAVELLLQREFPSAKIQLFPDLAGIPRAAVMRLT